MTDEPTYDVIQQIDGMPYGPEERALLAEAIRLADETRDTQLGYAARMRLTQSAHMTGDTDAMFSSFGWCVGMHDSDPVRFPLDTPGGNLLFQYKWMVGRLTTNPMFSLDQMDAMHVDMASRYLEYGATQSGVLQSRFTTAVLTGRYDEAEELREARNAVPEDEFSHCAACVRSEDAWYFQQIGDEPRALSVYDDIIENHLSCGAEPETAEAEALLPLLRAGRFADARAAHLHSYRVARRQPNSFNLIGHHLIFCAVTGNEARGLALLERHIGMIANDPLNQAAHFSAMLAVGVILDAVAAAGYGHQPVRGADTAELAGIYGGHSQPWTVNTLSMAAWNTAERLAASFNARNGNAHFTQRVRAARALADEHHDVPIATDTFRDPEPTVEEPTTADEWCERAIVFLMSGDAAAAKEAVETGLRLPIDNRRASLLGLAVRVNQSLGREEAAEESFQQRLAELRATGRADTAALEERLGMLLYDDNNPARFRVLRDELERSRDGGDPDDVVVELLLTTAEAALGDAEGTTAEAVTWVEELVSEAVTRTTVSDPHDIQPSARLLHSHTLLALGRLEEAIAELDVLVTADNRPRVRIPAMVIRAQIAGASNDYPTGIALAEELVALQARLGNRTGTVAASLLSAVLLSDHNRDEEAAHRMRYAIAQAELAELPNIPEFTAQLGRYLHYAGHSAEGLEKLDEAYTQLRAADAELTVLADILYVMGEAARVIDENAMAYGAWQQAVRYATEAGDNVLLMRASLALGTLLVNQGDKDSVGALRQATAAARALDNPQATILALQRLGNAQAFFGEEAGLATIEEAIALAGDQGSPWLIADLTDSLARGYQALGRIDEAVSAALRAADGYAESQDDASAALAELFVARALAEREHREEAVPLYQSARERLPIASPHWNIMSLELGDILADLGRHEEAAAVRSAVDSPPADLPAD
ncbi:hypothetical protein GCM10022198_03240 [Klugiella xanthotipulae]|uniref:Tetratricopeptide repeat protein n=1 Tax=Klugiella xanthotipulae TaxID=244735 RepID=A0A543I7A9_9MICO|nr:hypothetical protein [Klugiella xanthotipulae]TQM66380.1 hypothetical protein FB466_1220 [Klugiella xanthotipulae]